MRSSNGRWVVSYNGEIYNHGALRSEAIKFGDVQWRGHSDTESLVECLAAVGLHRTLNLCNGMFAFAAWDVANELLYLARDRFGEKPLYVGWVGDDIVFGSEISVFRQHPSWRHAVEERALPWLLQFGYIPAPWTIHPGIYKLPAASLIVLRRSDAGWRPDVRQFSSRIERWWNLGMVIARARQDPWTRSEREAVDAVEDLVDDSVRLRLAADVPVGALLSGGIDSSLVISSIARVGDPGVCSFTVAFEESGFDESAAAVRIAEHLGIDHEIVSLSAAAAASLVEELPCIYGEPFADPAQIPAVLVSRVARNKVTVALTGDGGDEFFHGYQRYLDAARWWPALSVTPVAVRRALGAVFRATASCLSPGNLSRGLWRQSERVAARDLDDFALALLRGTGSAATGLRDDPAYPAPTGAPALTSLEERLREIDQQLGLPEGIHTKLDRASMSVGLELRPPLLDHRLLELSWRFPANWHSREGVGKRILRQIVARRIPGSASMAAKRGFDVPISAWLRTSLRGWAQDLIESPSARADPAIDSRRLRELWAHHQLGSADMGRSLWAALMYLAWNKQHA